MSFTALHYGYAAEDDTPYSTLQPYYNPEKAKQVRSSRRHVFLYMFLPCQTCR